MELAGFFSIPEHARTALDIMQRSGYNVDGASITTGAHAQECLERYIAAERRWHTTSGALACGAIALIVCAVLLPPAPQPFPWLAVGASVIVAALLGALAGSLYGIALERQPVLLEVKVRKDHINEATHILQMAGGHFITTHALPNNSPPLAGQDITTTEPLKGATD